MPFETLDPWGDKPPKWTNVSMDAPPEPYEWSCLVCETSNPPGQLQCSRCGCPDRVAGRELFERQRQFALGQAYDGTHRGKPRSRIPGRRLDGSNAFAYTDLAGAAFMVLGAVLAVYQVAFAGHTTVLSSRHQTGIGISNPWALPFAAVGYLCWLSFGAATWVDHFDRRKHNEGQYARFRKWALGVGISCLLLSAAIQLAPH